MESKSKQNATPTPNTPIAIRLDILGKGKEVIHTSEYLKEKIVIGRILSADLRIDDAKVSRIHALIEVRNGSILATDLASSHGTFLNGEKIVEKKVNFGDTLKLGDVEIKIQKGSGKITAANQASISGASVFENDVTLTDMDRSWANKPSTSNRRGDDRRKSDAFPDERRLDDRRGGERRLDQRTETDPSTPPPLKGEGGDRRKSTERRLPLGYERRVGDRRKGDRRVFDITSLERRIEDRRDRKSDDDILPQELEKAFEAPSHARELEVTAMWGDHILDVSNYAYECELTVGESPRNDYIIPSVGIPDEFSMINVEQDGNAHLSFTDDMTGTVRVREQMFTLKEVQNEKFVKKSGNHYIITLKQDDFAKLEIGTVCFFILYVKPAPRIKAAPIFERDPLLIETTVGSFLLFIFLMVGMSFIPKPKPVTIEQIPERFAKIIIKKRPDIAKQGLIAKGEESKQGGSVAGEGGPAKGPEGEAGKKELPKKEEKAQTVLPKSKPKEKPAEQPPAQKAAAAPKRKVVDEKKAKSVGLLKAFSQKGVQSEMQNLLDAGEGAEGKGGFDDFGKAVSGFRGKSLEETGGAGGKGLKGVESGGGGTTIGIDGPSTKGLGRGYHGDGIGEGISGPGRFGQKGEHSISIVSENVQVLSGLSKDLINAVVQRHRSEIRACYDAALTRNPKLKGKVVMAFNIAPNGVVQTVSVKESTLGDSGLDNCIAARIRSWQFPKPEAPVVTEVSAYPFYLSPAN